MFKISKMFYFDSSHRLSGLPEDHKCARLHGHSYTAIVVLEKKELNSIGFVRDYGELKPIKEYIDSKLDHRHLNDCVEFNPTAELLAEYLFYEWKALVPELVEVTIKETAKTSATFIFGPHE